MVEVRVRVALEDEPLVVARPLQQRVRALRGDGHAEWVVVCRLDQGGTARAARQLAEDGTVTIDVEPGGRRPAASQGARQRGIRNAWDGDPLELQSLADQSHGGHQALAYDYRLRSRDDAPSPGQVCGELDPQLVDAACGAVSKGSIGQVVQRPGDRATPRGAREGGQVGDVRVKVQAPLRLLLGRRPRATLRADACSLPPAGRQEALVAQLRVGVEHDVARDAELGREPTARRQQCAGRQASTSDEVAEPGLELLAERRGRSSIQRDREDEIGPRHGR